MSAADNSITNNRGQADAGYRIGAASRLTGISADTLRVWERRYGVVTPRRSLKGGRRYSREDVSRLALLKRLVDNGHAIGSVAHLDIASLQERLQITSPKARNVKISQVAEQRCRVAVFGEALPARLLSSGDQEPDLELVAVTREFDAFVKAVSERRPNVIVLEYPTLKGAVVEEVNRLLRISEAGRALVVYAFAREETARKLASSRIVPLRAPVGLPELKLWCRNHRVVHEAMSGALGLGPMEQAPARLYNADELSKVAITSTAIKCECPRHLAELVFSLRAFEDYSMECENTDNADAALHAYLNNASGHARAILEEALARIIDAEGIEL